MTTEKTGSRRIVIFDTTLRDGEQSPGASMNLGEKMEIAEALADLGVDVIEAGFPIASPGDFEAVREIAKAVRGPTICGLARCREADIDRAWEAVQHAQRPRIHVFLATSAIHREYKLKMTKEDIVRQAVASVQRAKGYCSDVEFSPEDAARTEIDFLCEVVEAAIDAGATTVNIPDTVGYATPAHFGNVIRVLRQRVPNIDRAVISVHCHNDLGLAVANSLAAVENGAGQVECTINGIGERAGNCSLEEIVMMLRVRNDFYHADTGIVSQRIVPTSRLVAGITGIHVQRNKAIVGQNAFAHEAGIHQHGVLEHAATYEIMRPEDVGMEGSELVMGKHSGRHALQKAYADMGYTVEGDDLKRAFARFKEIADRKKTVSMLDLEALLDDQSRDTAERWTLERLALTTATGETSHADVVVREGGQTHAASAEGDGPIDAAFNALNTIVATPATLREFNVNAVTGGNDALGDVRVVLEHEGRTYTGQSVAPDITEAAAEAFLRAAALVAAGIPNPMARESV